MLGFNSSIAVIGNAKFREGKGGEIIFYAKEARDSVESLILNSEKETIKLSNIVSIILVLGGVLLIVRATVLFILPWIRRRNNRPIEESGDSSLSHDTWSGKNESNNIQDGEEHNQPKTE